MGPPSWRLVFFRVGLPGPIGNGERIVIKTLVGTGLVTKTKFVSRLFWVVREQIQSKLIKVIKELIGL